MQNKAAYVIIFRKGESFPEFTKEVLLCLKYLSPRTTESFGFCSSECSPETDIMPQERRTAARHLICWIKNISTL